MSNISFPIENQNNDMADYCFVSKYAMYDKSKKRRESWPEATNRVMKCLTKKYPQMEDIIQNELHAAFNNKEILGSQRLLQFAGKAVEKHNLRVYNCAGSYVDRLDFFHECMYVLLCGTGAGFSVQKHHIAKLPGLKSQDQIQSRTLKTFVIPDTIEGWADAVGVLVSSYFSEPIEKFREYADSHVIFDYTEIRPEGSPFSHGIGRAPGPAGLQKTLEKIKELLDRLVKSQVKNIRPIHAYDMVMHIADAVLSGGVRRSATICMFSHDDMEMIQAKSGNWFIENPQRARSNNSAMLLRNKITRKEFEKFKEYTKQFGEPGFLWVDSLEYIFNPCLTDDTWIHTSDGPRMISDLMGTQFEAVVDGKIEQSTEKGFYNTGTQEVFEIHTDHGYTLRGTANHLIETEESGWVPIHLLNENDSIKLQDQRQFSSWDGQGSYSDGWLLGSLVGDGTFHDDTAYLCYWGETKEHMRKYAVDLLHESVSCRSHCGSAKSFVPHDKITISSRGLYDLASEFDIDKTKVLTDSVEKTSSSFHKGFLSGWFDADGSVQGNTKKGVSIRLTSTSLENLRRGQRMLLRMGVVSKIYENRREAGYREMPDGHGNTKKYYCKAVHELIVSKENILRFSKTIGFSDPEKQEKLDSLINSYTRTLNRESFTSRVTGIRSAGIEKVYDCTIDSDRHAFDANGITSHNCVEIMFYCYNEQGESGWQFCNLSTINGSLVKNKTDFYHAAEMASLIGTLQAGFHDFPYLGRVTEEIVRKEALIGVSITGMMTNPDILFDPETQRNAASKVRRMNQRIAKAIGINQAARNTCVKPEGSTTTMLGLAALSGCHAGKGKYILRRIQANKSENPVGFYKNINPTSVEHSVWSSGGTDDVITFCCVSDDDVIQEKNLTALEFLSKVLSTQMNWVEYGTNEELCSEPTMRHNVSNTVRVRDDEWDSVWDYIYENRQHFAGISFLSMTGDKDYNQAPFCEVFTADQIVEEYGQCSLFSSGLIESALKYFPNLWDASSCLLGYGEIIDAQALRAKITFEWDNPEQKRDWKERGLSPRSINEELDVWLDQTVTNLSGKRYWIAKSKAFAGKYMDGNLRQYTYMIKDVFNNKLWHDIIREHKPVDYTKMIEEHNMTKGSEELACAGGTCEI